ncbi:MAG: PLP-dependent lyase/thiolase [Candidatus Dojkabacteria bacterium]
MQIITGKTEIEKYNHEGRDIYLKREDKNLSGSFKDRLVAYVWKDLQILPKEEITLSSSGNLAISLLYRQAKTSEPLRQRITIFIRENLPSTKQEKLVDLADQTGARILTSGKPKSDAKKYARDNNAYHFRNSEGDHYPKAYYRLAEEIKNYSDEYGVEFGAVYVCASSGTAALGITRYFNEKSIKIPVVITQTSYIHPIAKEFEKNAVSEKTTIANAISDRVVKRKGELVKELKKNQGGGAVCTNAEIEYALEKLRYMLGKPAEGFTGNAGLSFAGYIKKPVINPLVVISGN